MLQAQTIHKSFWDGVIYLKIRQTQSIILPEWKSDQSMEIWNSFPEWKSIIAEFGITQIRNAARIKDPVLQKYYEVRFSKIAEVYSLMERINRLSYIELTEQKPIMRQFLTPNDVNSQQWYINKIAAPLAWDLSTGNPEIVIAIVDDAVRTTHQDLTGNIWVNPLEIPNNNFDDDGNGYIDDINGWDVSNNDNNPNPVNPSNFSFTHGTHCAGIASAKTNNGLGIASIGFSCKIMAVKCKPDGDTGPNLPDVYDGVQYAIAAGARVISMSWGSDQGGSFGQAIMNAANSYDIVLVAAAGNDNVSTPFFPASYQNVISVGSTSTSDAKSSFSNYGSTIDVMAPGSNIYSTLAGSNTSYGNQSGTSMACPMVAGLCGLILSLNPDLYPYEVENCLKNGCDNIDAQNPNYIGQIGAGRINAYQSLLCAMPTPDLDVKAIAINGIGKVNCNGNLTPVFTLQNNGTQPLTSATINYSIDGGSAQTQLWSGNLASGASDLVNLPSQNFSVGQHTIQITVSNPNGGTDGILNNNTINLAFVVISPNPVGLPFTEDFESGTFATKGWSILNPDNNKTWEIVTTNGNTPGTKSARVNCFSYTSVGQRDGLISPVLDLTNYSSATLSFKHAHR
ncbi:MAG: S8 family serine peptidase, partial [Bacteroidia bacterium]|nr:S8 family serine peptidase [Bacteroidia bacterium]